MVSLTLTPMLAARLIKSRENAHHGRLYQLSENAFNGIISFYGETLKIVLRVQPLVLLIALGTLVLTIYLYIDIPKGLFPVQDTGIIQGVSEADQDISFPAMSAAPAGAGQHYSRTIPPSKASRPSSASMAPTPRSTTGASRSTSSRSTQRKIGVSRHHAAPAAEAGRRFRHHALHAAGAGPHRR